MAVILAAALGVEAQASSIMQSQTGSGSELNGRLVEMGEESAQGQPLERSSHLILE